MVADKKFDYGTASEMLGLFDGAPERVHQFIDTLDFLFEVTPEDHHGLLLKLVKTSLIGKARYVSSGSKDLKDIKEALKTHCAPVISSKLALAKLKAARRTGDALNFASKIEKLTDELNTQYLAESIPHAIAKRLADSSGLDALLRGASKAQTQFFLRAGSFKTIQDAIIKFLDGETTPDQFTQIFRQHQRKQQYKEHQILQYAIEKRLSSHYHNVKIFHGQPQKL